MGRPMKFDKDKALETAMHELWRSGYEASSVKALSEKLGITRASFYNAFGSREEMFRQALQKYGCQIPGRMLYEADEDTPLRPVLSRMFRRICDDRGSDPEARGCMAVNSIAELGSDHPDLACHLSELAGIDRARLKTLINWAVARGELRTETDIDALALSVQNLMFGINLQSKLTPDPDALWASARLALRSLDLLDENEDLSG